MNKTSSQVQLSWDLENSVEDSSLLVHSRSPSEPGCSRGCLSGGPHYAESASVHFGEWDVLMWRQKNTAPKHLNPGTLLPAQLPLEPKHQTLCAPQFPHQRNGDGDGIHLLNSLSWWAECGRWLKYSCQIESAQKVTIGAHSLPVVISVLHGGCIIHCISLYPKTLPYIRWNSAIWTMEWQSLNIFPGLRSSCSGVLFAPLKFCPDSSLLDARKPSSYRGATSPRY